MRSPVPREPLRRSLAACALLPLVAAGIVAGTAPAAAAQAAVTQPVAAAPAGNGNQFKVLVFTEPPGRRRRRPRPASPRSRQLGAQLRFTVQVTDDPRKFDRAHLKQYRVVVFLNTVGDVLDRRPAGRVRGVLPRRRRLRRRSTPRSRPSPAGRSSPTSSAPGRPASSAVAAATRQGGRPGAPGVRARCRCGGTAPTAGTTSPPTSAASPTCWPPSTRPPTPVARWASTTRSPGARTTRAAGRSTPDSAARRPASAPADLRAHLGGAIRWAAGATDGDCGATVLANYQMDFIARAAERQRADRLRRAARRPRGADRPPRRRAAARPGDQHHPPARPDPGLHGQRGRHVRPGGRQRLRHEQVGVPLLLAADHGGAVPGDHADGERADHRRRPERLGPVAAATSSSAGSSSSTGRRRPSTWPPSRRSSRCRSTAAPAATWPATSTSTRTTTCGWSPATTRPPAAATPAASRRTTTCSPRPGSTTRRTSTRAAPSLNTNDLRGKILRIKVQPDGSYTIPRRQPVHRRRGGRRQDPAARSTRWASATRSASRSTTTTSPTSPTTRRTRRRRRCSAGRPAPAG